MNPLDEAPAKPCLSGQNFHLSIIINKAYCVLNPSLSPHKKNVVRFFFNIRKTVGRALTGL